MGRIGKDVQYRTTKSGLHYYGLNHRLNSLCLGLKGSFQIRNAALALIAIERLEKKGFNTISSQNIREGLENLSWPGRMQIVGEEPEIILDGAHNPAAIKVLTQAIQSGFKYKRLILVIGVMEDKEIGSLLSGIVPAADYVFYTRPVYYRAANPEILASEASHLEKSGEVVQVLTEAIDKARAMADPQDLILIS